MSDKLLISACLLGQPVRYDGKSKGIEGVDWLFRLQQQNRLVVVCPEVAGGLPVPRPPAELVNDRVITSIGTDVTEPFNLGARKALDLCKQFDIKFALLKANSPSCGNRQIYNGQFSGQLISGQGTTARLLTQNGINVYSELELKALQHKFSQTALKKRGSPDNK